VRDRVQDRLDLLRAGDRGVHHLGDRDLARVQGRDQPDRVV
jgi:hypothetical protein